MKEGLMTPKFLQRPVLEIPSTQFSFGPSRGRPPVLGRTPRGNTATKSTPQAQSENAPRESSLMPPIQTQGGENEAGLAIPNVDEVNPSTSTVGSGQSLRTPLKVHQPTTKSQESRRVVESDSGLVDLRDKAATSTSISIPPRPRKTIGISLPSFTSFHKNRINQVLGPVQSTSRKFSASPLKYSSKTEKVPLPIQALETRGPVPNPFAQLTHNAPNAPSLRQDQFLDSSSQDRSQIQIQSKKTTTNELGPRVSSSLHDNKRSSLTKPSQDSEIDSEMSNSQLRLEDSETRSQDQDVQVDKEKFSTNLASSILEPSKVITDLAVVEANNILDQQNLVDPSKDPSKPSNLSDEVFLRAIGEKILRDGRQLQEYTKTIQDQIAKITQLEEALKAFKAKDEVSEQRNEVQELEVKKLTRRILSVQSLAQQMANDMQALRDDGKALKSQISVIKDERDGIARGLRHARQDLLGFTKTSSQQREQLQQLHIANSHIFKLEYSVNMLKEELTDRSRLLVVEKDRSIKLDNELTRWRDIMADKIQKPLDGPEKGIKAAKGAKASIKPPKRAASSTEVSKPPKRQKDNGNADAYPDQGLSHFGVRRSKRIEEKK